MVGGPEFSTLRIECRVFSNLRVSKHFNFLVILAHAQQNRESNYLAQN